MSFEWGTSDYWDERYRERDEPEPCVYCRFSGPNLVPCIVKDCDLLMHPECGAKCADCSKPVCLDHVQEFEGKQYCPEDYGCATEDQEETRPQCEHIGADCQTRDGLRLCQCSTLLCSEHAFMCRETTCTKVLGHCCSVESAHDQEFRCMVCHRAHMNAMNQKTEAA